MPENKSSGGKSWGIASKGQCIEMDRNGYLLVLAIGGLNHIVCSQVRKARSSHIQLESMLVTASTECEDKSRLTVFRAGK